MITQRSKKLVHEGGYLAEVEIELIIADDEWSPYLSLNEAAKLDEVRDALKNEDIARALQFGRVYKLTPAAA